jgi:putative hydrolase of HD superfamily
MEMSLAFYQKKPIYILNGLPEESAFEEEILGFEPIVLNGSLGSIADKSFASAEVSLTSRDVEFLYEMGTIRYIQRTWRQFLNPDFANLAEHHYRTAWIALSLAKQEGIVDSGKVLKMALLHDIAESRTGDVNYIQRQYVERNEDQGIKDILANTSLEGEFLSLIQEYEVRQSPESRVVKDADNLDVEFELREQQVRGHQVAEEKMRRRAQDVRGKLFTESARQMWDAVHAVNPHDWHLKGRNRHSSGDWKQDPAETIESAPSTLQPDSDGAFRWGQGA